MSMMSFEYRAIVYAAVATMHFYRDDLVPATPGVVEPLGTYYDRNHAVMMLVVAEIKEYFKYELSHEQVGDAIKAYLCAPCGYKRI